MNSLKRTDIVRHLGQLYANKRLKVVSGDGLARLNACMMQKRGTRDRAERPGHEQRAHRPGATRRARSPKGRPQTPGCWRQWKRTTWDDRPGEVIDRAQRVRAGQRETTPVGGEQEEDRRVARPLERGFRDQGPGPCSDECFDPAKGFEIVVDPKNAMLCH